MYAKKARKRWGIVFMKCKTNEKKVGERSQFKTMCLNKCNKGVGLGELGSAPIKVYGTVLLKGLALRVVQCCQKGTKNVKTHPPP